VPVRTAADLTGAVEVFRLAYERARRKAARPAAAAPETVIPGLLASPPEALPFDSTLQIRAFLLKRSAGDIQLYNAPAATFEPSRQYLNHRHEAGFGAAHAPLFVHAADRGAVAEHARVRASFSRRHTLDGDFEVIPTPGHTPGATAYLWDTGQHRVLFTGDTIYLRHGEWRAALLGSSDRESYLESLRLIHDLDFDVLVPWAATAGDAYHAVTSQADARRRIDAIIQRLWHGESG
jgi:Metallo-beta-lactamase superfamily